jgi:hypothetical protein
LDCSVLALKRERLRLATSSHEADEPDQRNEWDGEQYGRESYRDEWAEREQQSWQREREERNREDPQAR